MGRKPLNSADLEELRVWLAFVKFDATRLNRECSDGVRVAKLIHQLWPNTINLKNFPSQNSTARKMSNWQVLNRKVLTKLGIEQKQATLEKLTKGTEGAVEEVLYSIMNIKKSRDGKVAEANAKPEEQNEVADGDPVMMDPVMMDPLMMDPEMMDPEMDPVMMVPVKQTIGDVVVEVPQKMIIYSAYLKKVAECEKIELALQANMDKIEELKKLVEIGNKRILKLSAQLNLKDDNETVEEEELIHFSD